MGDHGAGPIKDLAHPISPRHLIREGLVGRERFVMGTCAHGPFPQLTRKSRVFAAFKEGLPSWFIPIATII